MELSNASIKIQKSDLYSIYFDLGEEFNNAVIKAEYERHTDGVDVFIRTMAQVEPFEKVLSEEEKQDIVRAVLEWNAHLNTISFV